MSGEEHSRENYASHENDLGLGQSTKRKRKREFLAPMEQVVPSVELVDLVLPYAPPRKTGHPSFEVHTTLGTQFMKQRFAVSDLAKEELLYERYAAQRIDRVDAGSQT